MGKGYKPAFNIKNITETSSMLINTTQAQETATGSYFPHGGTYRKGGYRLTKGEIKLFAEFAAVLLLLYGGHEFFKTNKYTKKQVNDLDAFFAGSFDFIYNQLAGVSAYGNNPSTVQIDVPQRPLSPAPTITPVNESAVKETPAGSVKYVLKYQTPDNHEITITGNSMQFMEDTVKVIEYGYHFSPVFSLKNTKTIGVLSEKINRDMVGGNGGTGINASAMHKWIESGLIETVVREAAHEEGHNYFTTYKNDSSEESADTFRDEVRESLRSVNKSKAKDFTENFDFSKWEKQIRVQK